MNNQNAEIIEQKIIDLLPTKGWNGDWVRAIPLMNAVKKASPVEYAAWLVNGSTLEWFEIARPHEHTEIYADRPKFGNPADPLPFDNDLHAIDAAHHIVCSN